MYLGVNVSPKELAQRAESLVRHSSNRYLTTVRIAFRAKQRRFDDFDGLLEDSMVKPVQRAIIELSDEQDQPDLLPGALQLQPPGAPLQLQGNGLLGHQLILQGTVLGHQVGHGLPQPLRLSGGELHGPALATDQHGKGLAVAIPGQPPTLAFALNQGFDRRDRTPSGPQPGSRSG